MYSLKWFRALLVDKRRDRLLSKIFEDPHNNTWLNLLENYTQPDFKLIGHHSKYLVILNTNKPANEPGWFETEFFHSLKPHQRILKTDEVVLNSGLILNVRDILKEPKGTDIDLALLTRRSFSGRY